MKEMLALLKMIKQGAYEVVIPEIVVDEIYENKNTKRLETLAKFISEIT